MGAASARVLFYASYCGIVDSVLGLAAVFWVRVPLSGPTTALLSADFEGRVATHAIREDAKGCPRRKKTSQGSPRLLSK